ncbi:ABC transporter permease [Methylocystis bryophila]|nr:ABC transporter permease [Methylocystis bryophila]
MAPPEISGQASGEARRLALTGAWTIAAARKLERAAQELVKRGRGARAVAIDLSSLELLDTAGALAVNDARHELAEKGVLASFEGASAEHALLLERVGFRETLPASRPVHPILATLGDLGEQIVMGLRDAFVIVAFLGQFVLAMARVVRKPRLFRGVSVVYQMENFALRSIPIIVTINITVGAIVAQQGIYELLRFGASIYVVDLVGILVLRELGVLLTSIMVAGRSGSAITAEIGSMKVREEVDALRSMGMSPMEVLVIPRILALIVSLPILTFIADISALFGGIMMSWWYGGITPSEFSGLLQTAVSVRTFSVGLIKAPFMALVIGLIATQEGLATAGSAESLGWRVTASVVKSIFTVIILDGLFAMFFTAINY